VCATGSVGVSGPDRMVGATGRRAVRLGKRYRAAKRRTEQVMERALFSDASDRAANVGLVIALLVLIAMMLWRR